MRCTLRQAFGFLALNVQGVHFARYAGDTACTNSLLMLSKTLRFRPIFGLQPDARLSASMRAIRYGREPTFRPGKHWVMQALRFVSLGSGDDGIAI